MQNKHKSLSFPYQSPLGELSILANEKYLLKISFSPSNLSPAETGKIPSHVIELINFLNRYFYNPNTIINTEIRIYRNDKLHSTLHTGKHDKVSRLHLDFTNITFNMEKIYIALLRIPPGEAVSYGYLAELAGFPRGARFAGTTMARNPFPLVIPCHRVIKSDMSLGGFGPGQPIKKKLLEDEKFL